MFKQKKEPNSQQFLFMKLNFSISTSSVVVQMLCSHIEVNVKIYFSDAELLSERPQLNIQVTCMLNITLTFACTPQLMLVGGQTSRPLEATVSISEQTGSLELLKSLKAHF